MTVHLLVDGYRQIACDGESFQISDDDTSNISRVTCRACLHRAHALYETRTKAVAVRLVELGETVL